MDEREDLGLRADEVEAGIDLAALRPVPHRVRLVRLRIMVVLQRVAARVLPAQVRRAREMQPRAVWESSGGADSG